MGGEIDVATAMAAGSHLPIRQFQMLYRGFGTLKGFFEYYVYILGRLRVL